MDKIMNNDQLPWQELLCCIVEFSVDHPLLIMVHLQAMQTWPEYEGSPMKQHLTESTFSTIDDENVEDAQKQDW